MTLLRWDPVRSVSNLQKQINDMFDHTYKKNSHHDGAHLSSWRPVVDVYDVEDSTIVEVELPGLTRNDVTVDINENVLTIKGERTRKVEIEDEDFHRQERSFGNFQRAFTLTEAIKPDQIKANFKDGLLEVIIPKPEEKRLNQVKIPIE